MHTLITGYLLTDHVNGNGLDNRRINLREATCRENQRNRRPNHGGSSPYKGVIWNKGKGKWEARIWVRSDKGLYLGRFTDEVEAAKAYDRAAGDLFGEFARPNFPEQDH